MLYLTKLLQIDKILEKVLQFIIVYVIMFARLFDEYVKYQI